jgi:hypothetical protein
LAWVLDPLNDLSHGDEVDVVVVSQDFVNPVEESVEELWVVLEPSSVIVETQWSTILVVVTLEVVV